MPDTSGPHPDLDVVRRQQSRRVLATLIRLLRDFDLAEEALHDAFLAAARKWPEQGMPANPLAWLISAGGSEPSTGCANPAGSWPSRMN